MTLLFILPASAPSPWSQAAVQDLTAMHDLIQENHPGPVDPQNPGFKEWLNGGEAALLPRAHAAATLHDYQLVLHEYANGFADGHLGVQMTDTEPHVWPGFLVRADTAAAPPRVAFTGEGAPAGIRVGDAMESCGGIPSRDLLRDRIMRPALNPHVPQRLPLASASLMVADADDPAGQWASCVASSGGADHPVALRWRPIDPAVLAKDEIRSGGIDVPPTGLRQFGDVWLISLPSFYPQDATTTARLQELVEAVKAHADTLHSARHVVLDLRGNNGGDDAWGFEIAVSLWGKSAVDAVVASMPTVIDWRVSPRNAAAIHADAALLRGQGQADGAAYFDKLADRMGHAIAAHAAFMREPADPAGPPLRAASPFAHPVYLLTTPHCASACLDFVDLMNGLPGVERVGLETSSDTDYLEMATAKLPSGHASLRYAMKVYRQRKRGANVSYKPEVTWPGGEMSDERVVRWVNTLP